MELPELSGRIALDIETYDPKLKTHGPGDIRRDGFIAGVAIAREADGWSAYYPLRHQQGWNVEDEDQFYEWLRHQLAKLDVETVLTNAQYDLGWLATKNVIVSGTIHDIQIAEPLLDENQFSYSLDAISRRRLGHGKPEEELYEWLAKNCGGAPTRAKQGANIWRAPAEVVLPYAIGDVELPLRILRKQEAALDEQGLTETYRMERGLIKPLLLMRRRGVRVNMEKTEQVAAQLKAKEDAARAKLGVDSVWAATELAAVFDRAGIEYGRTPTGKPSFRAGWLESRADAGCELSHNILAVRQAEKARSTFVEGYVKGHAIDGRIHAQFHQMKSDDGGTVTGRFCVANWTPVQTDKGRVRIDQIEPGEHRVLSHTGRWNKVLRRIYKGDETMIRVSFADGSIVECTRSHRFWDGEGWTRAGNLRAGDEVPHVGSEEHSEQARVSGEGLEGLQGRVEADDSGTSAEDRKHPAQRGVRSTELYERGGVQRGEGAALLAVKDRGKESDDGEKRARSPQLSRANVGAGRLRERTPARLDDVSSNSEPRTRASSCDLRSVWTDRDSSGRSRTPHKRGAVRQLDEQLGACDERGAPTTSRKVAITSIDEVGVASVWDIEVARDHSYLACGVFHHNSSSNPNLQNIPARDPEMGPLIRGLFYPDEGEEWVSHDWSQVEYRLLTHYGRGPSADAAREAYRTDPTTDFHQFTADLTGLDRKPAKNINFGLCIAENELVTTQRGLVPIQNVLGSDRLWDGVEWVTHDGVISKGEQRVIAYQGLTATPDHEVWTEQQGKVQLRIAASKSLTLQRSSPPLDRDALGIAEDNGRVPKEQRVVSLGGLFGLWSGEKGWGAECAQGQVKNVPMSTSSISLPPTRQKSRGAKDAVRHDVSALRKRYAQAVEGLRRARDRAALQVERGLCVVGAPEMAGDGFQGTRDRPHQQRLSLHARQSAARNVEREQAKRPAQKRPTYDILNAGPRRRFTCSGVIVSNCYGMGKRKLANDLGLSADEAEAIFSTYHSKQAFVREFSRAAARAAARRGWVKTIGGRRRRFEFWEAKDWALSRLVKPTSDPEDAKVNVQEAWEALDEGERRRVRRGIKRAYTHKAANSIIQGGAADLMKKAMVDVWESGVCDVLGMPLLTVHDELAWSRPRTRAGNEAIAEARQLMIDVWPGLRVPLMVDEERGEHWGALKEI